MYLCMCMYKYLTKRVSTAAVEKGQKNWFKCCVAEFSQIYGISGK